METLSIALWITLIGMGLVFLAIILLWGVMAILVKLTSSKESDVFDIEETIESEDLNRKRAAIAAVVIALVRQESYIEPHEFPLPPTAAVSPWQSVMRTKMLNKRGQVR